MAVTGDAGEDAFVTLYDLGNYPGTLIVFQRHKHVLSAWRSSVTQVTTLAPNSAMVCC